MDGDGDDGDGLVVGTARSGSGVDASARTHACVRLVASARFAVLGPWCFIPSAPLADAALQTSSTAQLTQTVVTTLSSGSALSHVMVGCGGTADL